MTNKIIKHGNHVKNNDMDGYMYNFNTSHGSDFNSHFHSCYEFIHVIHGQLIYTIEGSDYMLSDGDMVMTKPEELHSFSFPDECEYQREFLHIYPNFLKDYPQLIKTLSERETGYFNRLGKDIVRKYDIDKIFRGIEKCCTVITPETDFLVLTLTLQLVTKIQQILRDESPEHQMIAKNTKTNIVYDYIDKHFMEQISLEEMAKSMYISQPYLSRVFKRETGMTIKEYMNLRRVTHAKNLIVQGQQHITSIYWDCGFRDYSTFYRAFVKYVGMSPEEFKLKKRNI